MVQAKICGIKTWDDAKVAVDAGADALGFVFAPSPRRVNSETAREIILRLPPFISCVGVFVDEPRYSVMELATFCRLDVLQFHGHEEPHYCRGFSQRTIKGFRIKDTYSLEEVAAYEPEVDALLFDTHIDGTSGGTGVTFNWELLRGRDFKRPVILAGGLNAENVVEAIREVRPYAVDVSSGVETAGKKDPAKIKEFLAAVAGQG